MVCTDLLLVVATELIVALKHDLHLVNGLGLKFKYV